MKLGNFVYYQVYYCYFATLINVFSSLLFRYKHLNLYSFTVVRFTYLGCLLTYSHRFCRVKHYFSPNC